MIMTFRVGVLVTFVAIVGFPLLNLFASNTVALWIGNKESFLILLFIFLAGLGCVAFVRAICGQFTFSTVFALISNSVEPSLMGAANGLGQVD